MAVDDGLRDVDELSIPLTRLSAEQLECLLFFDRVAFHQDSFCPFGDGAASKRSFEVVVFRKAQQDDLDRVCQAAGSSSSI
ncbi:MAG TPA: hypothetical protein VIL96_01930 [Gaiellaceae bacterium]